MTPATKEALENFAKNVQWQTAGSLVDQERLLDFIIAAYKNGDFDIEQDEFLDVVNAFDTARDTYTTEQKKRSISYKLYTYQKYEEGIRLLRRAGEIR